MESIVRGSQCKKFLKVFKKDISYINKHALQSKKKHTLVPNVIWFDEEFECIRIGKQVLFRAETKEMSPKAIHDFVKATDLTTTNAIKKLKKLDIKIDY